MRALLRDFVCGLAVAAALTGTASADERLVMPFACRAEGGKVVLVPSKPQSYRIYGTREHRRLTNCAPIAPGRCRSWTVHRFDLDCSGIRTSWPTVVAAMTPFVTGPRHTYAGPGPMYGRPPLPPGPPRFGPPPVRFGPYAPPRPYAVYPPAPPPMANIPPGFAPIPKRLAHFVQGPAEPEIAAKQIPLPARKPPAQESTEVARGTANLPSTAPASSASAGDDSGETPSKAQGVEVASTAKPDQPPSPSASRPTASSGETTGAIPKPDRGRVWSSAMMTFGFALAALILFSTMLLLSLRRTKSMDLTIALAREPVERATFAEPGVATSSAERRADIPSNGTRSRDNEWLPSTLGEALEVLGVGPEAGADVIKVTVKRLRRSWHPDHAIHEEDRRARELRLKQINVAWDIVSGKRRSRGSSISPQAR